MSVGYDDIGEPLYLSQKQQAWFNSFCTVAPTGKSNAPAIILGATDWLVDAARADHDQVIVVDHSEVMLNRIREGRPSMEGITPVQMDWKAMTPECLGLAEIATVVCGDNSFSYLEFPGEWRTVLSQLKRMSSRDARVALRFLAWPLQPAPRDFQGIVTRFERLPWLTSTVLRVALLFSCQDPATYRISTESAAQLYLSQAAELDGLLTHLPSKARADLSTMSKYIGAGADYFAPPIGQILEVVSEHFDVESINYGQYPLGEWFPLVVARRP